MNNRPGIGAARTSQVLLLAMVLACTVAAAQYYRGNRQWRRSHWIDPKVDRNGVPRWENDESFKEDVFTFVRIQYSGGGYGRGGQWDTDYPDSDLNLSYRLQELTSLKVDPDGKILMFDDPELLNYPFCYVIEPGRMSLTQTEVLGLRKYLDNGGFMMVDDFWGDWEWDNFESQMKRVYPDRPFVELPLEHDIFHCVYDLTEKPQIPSINHYLGGRQWEGGSDGREVHYRGWFDAKGRLMAIVCHNTDLGDGWEREGVDQGYFKEYSERWAYPMGINIVTYAMTH